MTLIINNVAIAPAQGDQAATTTSRHKIIEGSPLPEVDLADFATAEITIEAASPDPTLEQKAADGRAKMDAMLYGLGPLRFPASAALAKTEQLEELVAEFVPELRRESWDISVDEQGETVVLGDLLTDEDKSFIKSMASTLGLDDAMAAYRDGVMEMLDISRSVLGPAGTWDLTEDNFSEIFRFREFVEDAGPPVDRYRRSLDGTYFNTLGALQKQLSERASLVPRTALSTYV